MLPHSTFSTIPLLENSAKKRRSIRELLSVPAQAVVLLASRDSVSQSLLHCPSFAAYFVACVVPLFWAAKRKTMENKKMKNKKKRRNEKD